MSSVQTRVAISGLATLILAAVGCGSGDPPPAPVANPYHTATPSPQPVAPPAAPPPSLANAAVASSPETAHSPEAATSPDTATNPAEEPATAPRSPDSRPGFPTAGAPGMPRPGAGTTYPGISTPVNESAATPPADAAGGINGAAGMNTARTGDQPDTADTPSPAAPTGAGLSSNAPSTLPPNDPDNVRSFGRSRTTETVSSWSVVPDPAPEGTQVPPDAKLGIRIPGLKAAAGKTPDWVREMREGGHVRILYPHLPSPFVGLGLNERSNQFREVWDLRTKKKVGVIGKLELARSTLMDLSPDGRFFAAKPYWAKVVGVYDVAGQQPIQAIPLESGRTSLVTFAADNRLLFEDNDVLQIWTVPDFELQGTIDLPHWRTDDAWSLSPGGRYLLIVDGTGFRQNLSFYDVITGELAGRIETEHRGSFVGTAHTTDGTRLASLNDGYFGGVLLIWNLQDGSIEKEIPLAERLWKQIDPHDKYQGPAVEWFPDGRHLLIYGRGVFDTDSEQLIANLPDKTTYRIGILDERQIAVVQNQSITRYDLSEHFENAAAAIAAGGTADDANLPPLTRADRSTARTIPLAERAAPWNVTPDPVTSAVKLTSRPLQIPGGQVFRAAMSDLEAARLVVMYSADRIDTRTNRFFRTPEPTKVWVEQFDLRNRRDGRQIALPFTTLMMDVSPDGQKMVTAIADGLDRLDLWSLEDGSHIAGFRPYVAEDKPTSRIVSYAEFVDDEHLLTVAAGRMILWHLPDCTAVYEVAIGDVRPVLSPARRYVAVADPDHYSFTLLEARTGQVAGAIGFPGIAPGYVSACGFHTNGKWMAAITWRMSGGELAIINMETGADVRRFPLPITCRHLQWCNDDFLLLDGTSLINLNTESVVWKYILPVGMHLTDSPDGAHWYISANSPQDRKFVVNGVRLPEESILGEATDPNFRFPLLLQPGGSVRLDLQLPTPPDDSDFAKRVREQLIARYAVADILVDDAAGVSLTITGKQESTGQQLTNDPLGINRRFGSMGRPTVQLAGQKITWDITMQASSQIDWETNMVATNSGMFSYRRDASDAEIQRDAERQMTEAMWQRARSQLENFEPPKYLFPAGASDGKGASELTVRGPERRR